MKEDQEVAGRCNSWFLAGSWIKTTTVDQGGGVCLKSQDSGRPRQENGKFKPLLGNTLSHNLKIKIRKGLRM